MDKPLKVYAMRCDDNHDLPYRGGIEIVNDDLDTFYRELECSCIQIIPIDGLDYICDDNGKLSKKSSNRAILAKDGQQIVDMFVGSVFVCRHDGNGELADILESDVATIERDCPCLIGFTRNKKEAIILDASKLPIHPNHKGQKHPLFEKEIYHYVDW